MVADRVTSYVFRGNFTNLGAGLTTMGKSVGDLGVKLTALDKQGAASRRGLTQLGSTAGKIGLVAAAGVGAVILSAANFDQAMSRVQAATGVAADGLDELRNAAIKAGAQTVFSATEAADAITAMSKAGVSAKDILAGGLDGALALASAGELDVAQAADIAATAMNQFGLAGADIPHIADLLAAGAASAQGEVTDFATALKYVGPVAHQMGISIEETTGVIAELASQGVLADQAGTSLRGMLTALTSPSVMAKKQLEALGITLYDAQGQFIGFEGVAGQLHDTLGGLTNAERDQALGRIFGNEQITAARILYAGGADAVEKWTTAVDKDGAAADIAATKLNNLKGDLEQLNGSLETAFIGSGSGAQGPLRSLVQGATSAVNAFNKLPPSIQGTATALAGVTAITGGSLWFGAKVVNGISDTKQALKELGVSADRLNSIMTGLKTSALVGGVFFGIAAGVDALHASMDKAVPSTEKLTNYLLNLSDAQAANNLAQGLGDLGGALDTLDNPGAADSVNNLYEKIPLIGSAAKDAAGLIPVFGANLYEADQQARDAASSVDALDAALANIVSSGSPDQAASVLEKLSSLYGLSDAQQQALIKHLPQYADALAGVANQTSLSGDAASGAATATDGLTTSTDGMGQAATDAAQQVEDLIKAMQDQKDAALQAFDAETAYRQAMKDATAQAKKSDAGIKGNSDAALKNRDTLSGLIGAWNSLDATTTDNVKKFKEARENFIKTAGGMKVSESAATKLWQEMAKIPSSKVIPVSTPGLDAAIPKAKTLKQILDGLHSKDINIALHYQTLGNKPHAPLPGDSGSTVPRTSNPRTSGLGLTITPRADELAGASNSYALHALGALAKSSDDASDSNEDAAKHAKGLKERLAEAEQHLAKMSRAADDAHDALDSLKSQRDDLSSSVSGSLSQDLFGGSLAQFQGGLSLEVAQSTAVLSALKALIANGVDPHSDFFKRLAASGNVALIQQFASLTRDQLAGQVAQFNAGAGGLAAVGQFAGSAAFNDLIKAQAKVADHLDNSVQNLTHTVNQLEKAVKAMPDKVKQGSHDGSKSGSEEGGKRVATAISGQVASGYRRGRG